MAEAGLVAAGSGANWQTWHAGVQVVKALFDGGIDGDTAGFGIVAHLCCFAPARGGMAQAAIKLPIHSNETLSQSLMSLKGP